MSNEDADNLIRLAEYQKKGGGIISEHTAALAFTEEHRGRLRFDHDTIEPDQLLPGQPIGEAAAHTPMLS